MLLTQDKQVVPTSDPGACHIELSMGEAGFCELKPCHLKGLALRFIDGHGKAEANRKLESLEAEPKVTRRRYEWNSWDHHLLPLGTATEDCGHYNMGLQLLHHQSCSIAQSWGIQVPQQHDGSSFLEAEDMRRKSRGITGVQKLNWIVC